MNRTLAGEHTIRNTWQPYPRYLLRKDLVRKILKNFDTSGTKCLEIGYGAGDMLILYAELGMNVQGFDFSHAAWKNAKARIERESLLKDNIQFLKNIEGIGINSYDFIFAFEVLEHIEDDLSTLRKWHTYLKENGKILISVPAHKRRWGASDEATGHYRRYEKEELKGLCEKAGINIKQFFSYGYPLTEVLDPLMNQAYQNKAAEKKKFSKEDFSKDSGVKRKRNIFYKLIFNDFCLFPFYFIQRLFYNFDLSSSYLIVGEK